MTANARALRFVSLLALLILLPSTSASRTHKENERIDTDPAALSSFFDLPFARSVMSSFLDDGKSLAMRRLQVAPNYLDSNAFPEQDPFQVTDEGDITVPGSYSPGSPPFSLDPSTYMPPGLLPGTYMPPTESPNTMPGISPTAMYPPPGDLPDAPMPPMIIDPPMMSPTMMSPMMFPPVLSPSPDVSPSPTVSPSPVMSPSPAVSPSPVVSPSPAVSPSPVMIPTIPGSGQSEDLASPPPQRLAKIYTIAYQGIAYADVLTIQSSFKASIVSGLASYTKLPASDITVLSLAPGGSDVRATTGYIIATVSQEFTGYTATEVDAVVSDMEARTSTVFAAMVTEHSLSQVSMISQAGTVDPSSTSASPSPPPPSPPPPLPPSGGAATSTTNVLLMVVIGLASIALMQVV